MLKLLKSMIILTLNIIQINKTKINPEKLINNIS